MPSQWIYRIHVIVPESDKDTANSMCDAVDAATSSNDFGGSFQDANVSTLGAFPPTHIFANSALKQAMLDALITILPDWATYSLSAEPQYWVMLVADGSLIASNTSAADVGNPWGIDGIATLAAAGLAWTQFPEE